MSEVRINSKNNRILAKIAELKKQKENLDAENVNLKHEIKYVKMQIEMGQQMGRVPYSTNQQVYVQPQESYTEMLESKSTSVFDQYL